MAAVKSNIQIKVGPFFGIGVNVLTAIEDDKKATALSTLCQGPGDPKQAHAPNKIHQKLVCATCFNDDKETFVKGQERADGSFAIIDTGALAEAVELDDQVKSTLTLTSHPVEQVLEHTLPSGKVYYLEPAKGSQASYPLLAEMLRQRPNLAFCTVWAARTVPAMYRLGLYGDVLTLTQLAWPESVKDSPKVGTDTNPAEVGMALTLADQLTSDFDPATFKDTRVETLAAFIAAADGTPGLAVPTTPKAVKPQNSMLDMLAAAVAASAPAAAAKAAPKARKAPVKKAVA